VKAVVKTERAPGHVELQERPEPTAGPGQVVLRVAYAGICGTDVHILHDSHPYWPPVVMGHEFTGTVEAVGDGVDPALRGTRVVCEPHAGACGTCRLCREGHAQLCSSKRSPGWGIDGAFAPLVAVPAHLLHIVPDGVPERAAAMCEPLAIVLSALQRTPVAPGDRVVVIGPGPIGLLAAMAARATGAGAVLIVGHDDSRPRLAIAEELGFDTAAAPEDAKAWTGDQPGGEVDLVIESTGSAGGVGLGISLLRRRGRMVAIGVSGRPDIPFPWDQAVFKALDISFSFSSAHTAWDGALSLLASGAITTDTLTTVFPLERWADALQAVEESTVVKALLSPRGESDLAEADHDEAEAGQTQASQTEAELERSTT
jgi:L-iditol 2-dehydrogenase